MALAQGKISALLVLSKIQLLHAPFMYPLVTTENERRTKEEKSGLKDKTEKCKGRKFKVPMSLSGCVSEK